MAKPGRFLVVLSLIAVAACQGGEGDGGSATADAAANATDASATSLQLTCNADSSITFPAFERGCLDATDCAIATHQTDCCGNAIATGIAQSDLAAFQQAEAACQPLFPACGCPAMPPRLDDGTTAGNPDSVALRCTGEGICETFSAP